MTSPPAFQFYPSDWLASERVALMTLEEEGAYIRLLCYCWKHGSIPSNPQKIAFLIGKGASTTLATTLATMFEPDPEDSTKLVHTRLKAEKHKQEEWRRKSSAGGKKSMEKRRLMENNKPPLEPPLQPPLQPPLEPPLEPPLQGWLDFGCNQNPTLQSSSLSLKENTYATSSPVCESENKEKKIKHQEQEKASLFFEKEIWSPFPCRNGKKLEKAAARSFFVNKIKKEQWNDIAKAVANYSKSKSVQEGIGIVDCIRFIRPRKMGSNLLPAKYTEWLTTENTRINETTEERLCRENKEKLIQSRVEKSGEPHV